MMITEVTIALISNYANLEWKPEEKEGIKRDMDEIRQYMEMLAEIDTQGIEPLSHLFPTGNVFREDEVTNGEQKDAMLINASETEEGCFLVPKAI